MPEAKRAALIHDQGWGEGDDDDDDDDDNCTGRSMTTTTTMITIMSMMIMPTTMTTTITATMEVFCVGRKQRLLFSLKLLLKFFYHVSTRKKVFFAFSCADPNRLSKSKVKIDRSIFTFLPANFAISIFFLDFLFIGNFSFLLSNYSWTPQWRIRK